MQVFVTNLLKQEMKTKKSNQEKAVSISYLSAKKYIFKSPLPFSEARNIKLSPTLADR